MFIPFRMPYEYELDLTDWPLSMQGLRRNFTHFTRTLEDVSQLKSHEPEFGAALPFVFLLLRGKRFSATSENFKNLVVYLSNYLSQMNVDHSEIDRILKQLAGNQANRVKLLKALKFDSYDLDVKKLKADLRHGFEPYRSWKHDIRTKRKEKEMRDMFAVLKSILNFHDNDWDSTSSVTGSFIDESTMGDDEDQEEASMSLSHDPLIEKGIPRSFFTKSKLEFAIPIFGYFYQKEFENTGDCNSLIWLSKVFLKRLRCDYNPVVLRYALDLSRLTDDKSVIGDLEEVAFSRSDFKLTSGEIESFLKTVEDDEDVDDIETEMNPKLLLKLSPKIVLKLDDKNDEVRSWTFLKTVCNSILKCSPDIVSDWMVDNFNVPRILCWNQLYFEGPQRPILEPKSRTNIKWEMEIFFDRLWIKMYGENPSAEALKRVFQSGASMAINKMLEDYELQKPKDDSKSKQIKLLTVEDMWTVYRFKVPHVDPYIYEKIDLNRDMGLLLEMPKNIVFHVVLKFIQKNKLVSVEHKKRHRFFRHKKGEIAFKKLNLEQVLVAEEVTEMQFKRGEFKPKYLEFPIRFLCKINDQVSDEITNAFNAIFYSSNRKHIASKVAQQFGHDGKDVRALVDIMTGKVQWIAQRNEEGIRMIWVKETLQRIKGILNYAPFDRQVESVRNRSTKIIKKYEIPANVFAECLDKLVTHSRKPMTLEASIRAAVGREEFSEHCDKLRKLMKKYFSKMITK